MTARDDGTGTADAVLAPIPASLLAAAAAFPLSPGAVALGCLPASGSIGYARFYDPPATQ